MLSGVSTDQVQPSEQNGLKEYSLFEDIVISEIPGVPESLAPFYRTEASQSEIRSEAESVFLLWLRRELTAGRQEITAEASRHFEDRGVKIKFTALGLPIFPDGYELSCKDDPTSFFPEYPDAEDFGAEWAADRRFRFPHPDNQDPDAAVKGDPFRTEDPEYHRQIRLANLQTATAQRACAECPTRLNCLASAIVDKEDPDLVLCGIWGGWSGPYLTQETEDLGVRAKIATRFWQIVKFYTQGKKSTHQGRDISNWKGMEESLMASYEIMALSLQDPEPTTAVSLGIPKVRHS